MDPLGGAADEERGRERGDPPGRVPSSAAVEAFVAHLANLESGREEDFEAVLGAHRDLAADLSLLRAEWCRVHAILERLPPPTGFAAAVAERYGLAPDGEDAGSAPVRETLPEDVPEAGARTAQRSTDGRTSAPDLGRPGPDGRDPVAAWLAARPPSARRYSARREVARGGMGRIVEVWDEDLRRRLAMKVVLDRVRAPASDESGASRRLARFLEEAQITSQLDHPGIVPVHEVGRDEEGRIFFTMRLVDGRDLREIIELARAGREGWSRTRVLGAILKVCEAMAYAHSKDVVHRDLKPGNVMVGRFGETYVMDWGLAKVMGRPDPHDLRLAVDGAKEGGAGGRDGRERPSGGARLDPVVTTRSESLSESDSPLRTLDGDIVGTPAYMAPEQALGRLEEVGPHSDIYSVGALLYHLLAGQMPFEPLGEKVRATAILEAVRNGPPWPLRKLDPTLPAELVAIAEKAMARAPRERYASMLEMAEDLRAYLEGRVVSAYTSGVLYEARKWIERNQGVAAALLALLLLALGSGAFFVWQQAQNLEQLGREQAATTVALGRAIDAEEELRSKIDELEAAQHLLESERDRADEKAREAFDQRRQAIEQMDLAARNASRAERQTYRANLIAAESSLRLRELARALTALEACEPTLRGWEWQHLMLQTDESVARRSDLFRGASHVALGSDGRHLVSAGHDRVNARVHDLETGAVSTLAGAVLPTLFGQAPPQIAALAPGGLAAATANGREIQLWNAAEAVPLQRLVGHTENVTAVRWSPDGRRIVSAAGDGTARVWEPLTGHAIAVLEGAEGPLRVAASSPDRTRVAAGGDDRLVRIWRLRAAGQPAELVHVLAGHSRPVTDLSWSPTDRRWLVSASEDGTLILWDVDQGDKHTMLRDHVGPVWSCAFNADGSRVLSGGADGTVRIWNSETGDVLRVLTGHREAVSGVVGLPDGRVLSVSLDGSVRTWDPEWRPEVVTLEAWGAVAALGHDPARGRVLAWPRRGGARGWDAQTGELLFVHPRVEDGPSRGTARAVYAPDGRLAAESAAGTRGRVVLVRTDTGEVARTLDEARGGTVGLAFSGDGRRLALAHADDTLRVHDLEDAEAPPVVVTDLGRRVRAIALGPTGRLLAVATADGSLRIHDLAQGRTIALHSRAHPRGVTAIAFDPRGERLLTSSPDGTLAMRRVGEREIELRLLGHSGEILSIAFDPRGQRVAGGGADGRVYVWDTLWGDLVLVLGGHDGPVNSVAFTTDGVRLISGDERGRVRVWDSAPSGPRHARLVRSRQALAAAGELVDGLFERLRWSGLVELALDSNRTLQPEVREAALRLTRIRGSDPAFLTRKVYEVVLGADAQPKELAEALATARQAHHIRPDLAATVGVLGAALVRAGEVEEGLALLERAIAERRAADLPPDARDFGFRALGLLARGELGPARGDLARMRALSEGLDAPERVALFGLGQELERRLEDLGGTQEDP